MILSFASDSVIAKAVLEGGRNPERFLDGFLSVVLKEGFGRFEKDNVG